MKIIDPGYQILTPISDGGFHELRRIEQAARVCYKSNDIPREEPPSEFVRRLIAKGHEAMIEHSQLSVIFTVDRGITHELVRHRIASFAQESTRYCNYSLGKFGEEITVIRPYYLEEGSPEYNVWLYSCEQAEFSYMRMLERGCTPQEARCVLPTCLKAELVMTANYREWRMIFKLRTADGAHPQMRQVMWPLLKELQSKLEPVFGDINNE